MESGRNNKIIVILGPTASGKSDVAIKLARKFSGEIISADSRQIYRGMDIGSGKVPRDISGTISNDQFPRLDSQKQSLVDARRAISKHKELFISNEVVHHLIDVANPNDEFNISHFKNLAEKTIEDILKRGKLPIICGGTGFWIKSLVDNVKLPEVKPNAELRRKLEQNSTEELFLMLEKMDSQRSKNIDAKNKVRLIRAIEICNAIGIVPKYKSKNNKYEFLQIGIDIQKEVLNEKIKKRLGQRFSMGMIEEVQNLNKNGAPWERLEYFGLEYRWIARYLQEKISLDEMMDKLYFDIIHYAKRQMTWFKKDKRILWLKDYKEIEKTVKNFLN
jgi:tRNA dimethylallyltransferase